MHQTSFTQTAKSPPCQAEGQLRQQLRFFLAADYSPVIRDHCLSPYQSSDGMLSYPLCSNSIKLRFFTCVEINMIG
jgi:hypothetical protein